MESADRHLADSVNQLQLVLNEFSGMKKAIKQNSSYLETLTYRANSAEHRLDDLRPVPTNCPHCSRKVGKGAAKCGVCGKSLR